MTLRTAPRPSAKQTVKLRLQATQKARWERVARRKGMSVSMLVRLAVEASLRTAVP